MKLAEHQSLICSQNSSQSMKGGAKETLKSAGQAIVCGFVHREYRNVNW
jgi:hypothetical protein